MERERYQECDGALPLWTTGRLLDNKIEFYSDVCGWNHDEQTSLSVHSIAGDRTCDGTFLGIK